MAYATGDDIVLRFDKRLVGDLVADDNVRVTSNWNTNPVLVALIADADAAIDAALRQANRYTDDQLADLATAGNALLKRVACGLVMGMLGARRGQPLESGVQDQVDDANDMLDALRAGRKVLDVAENRQAGVVAASVVTNSNRNTLRRLSDMRFFPPKAGGTL